MANHKREFRELVIKTFTMAWFRTIVAFWEYRDLPQEVRDYNIHETMLEVVHGANCGAVQRVTIEKICAAAEVRMLIAIRDNPFKAEDAVGAFVASLSDTVSLILPGEAGLAPIITGHIARACEEMAKAGRDTSLPFSLN